MYGEANPGLTATMSGFKGTDTGANATSGTPICSTTAGHFSDVGTYAISCTDRTLTSSNYSFIFVDMGVLTITKAVLTVSSDNQTKVYGEVNPALTASMSGFKGTDTRANATTGAPACLTSAGQASGVGDYAISCVVGTLSATNYSFTFVNSGNLTVTKAPLTISAANSSKVYGQANPTFSGSIVGLKNSDAITASYATTATAPSPVGTYAIVPTAIDSTPLPKLANYQVTLVNGTLDGGQGGADADRGRQVEDLRWRRTRP